MLSVMQSILARESTGTPIPTVYPSLSSMDVELYRGQLSLVASGPGVGKSTVALNIALHSGVSCLYFSADSDRFQQSLRVVQILTGWHKDVAGEIVRNSHGGRVADRVANLPIRFNYESSPSLSTMDMHTESYAEVYGDYPELIVVDNVTNIDSETPMDSEGDPFAGLEGLMDYLSGMARETQAHVMGLHHVKGEYSDGDKPVPRSGLKGQIHRVPALILTMYGWGGDIYISPVKNRSGYQDPSGQEIAELQFDGGDMRVSEKEEVHGLHSGGD